MYAERTVREALTAIIGQRRPTTASTSQYRQSKYDDDPHEMVKPSHYLRQSGQLGHHSFYVCGAFISHVNLCGGYRLIDFHDDDTV